MDDPVRSPRFERAAGMLAALAGPAFEDIDSERRTIRQVLLTTYVCLVPLTFMWGVAYHFLDETAAGLIPAGYAVLTAVAVLVLPRAGRWESLRIAQLACHLLLPFFLMWTLGGFGPSSAVLIWAFLAPVGSLWAGRPREAVVVVIGFAALTVFSAGIDSSLRDTNNLPEAASIGFYAGNFVVMAILVFSLLLYFVNQHRSVVSVLQRNRELESAYLQQELSLRQTEKLATVGRLSAGLAHELNNPAAAVQQATQELSTMLLGDEKIDLEIQRLGLLDAEVTSLRDFASTIRERSERPQFLDPLDRSERSEDVEARLEAAGLEQAWEAAPVLVDLGLTPEDVDTLGAVIRPDHLGGAVGVLAEQYHRQSLLGSLEESTGRIVELVRALKSYTYLDQAPRQPIDVHDGLDSTLVMLQNRLKSGIEVQRDYGRYLPEIEAFGGELNQVWTNLLDNAVDAMDGQGVIEIRTSVDGDAVVVEFTDDGPGIDGDLLDRIFDPFVTTKPPGEGTGLGLNISHRIVTERHGGEISVHSTPGRTVFSVRLPLLPPSDLSTADEDSTPTPTPIAEAP